MQHDTRIAVIGMAGRFPGASSCRALWEDVILPGAEPVYRVTNEGGAVVGHGVVQDAEMFDAPLFEMSPDEARTVSPEHRLFLECAWSALEDAGINPLASSDFISVYGSASNHSASYMRRILRSADDEQLVGAFGVLLGNAMDSLATRVGYKLGLRGECITVQTHCSSSLVAIHLACQSLLAGNSDVALAGGVSVRASVEADREAELSSVVAQEGFILSSDGQCRALLEGANGTINGDGAAIVVLKLLEHALRDGNPIYATIRGTGLNNDGRRKVGFTAPSVEGVEDAIHDALAFAELVPDDIGFIECHGTGTQLGDAIELRALRRVFETDSRASALNLGSIKSNIGHLAAGAGVTGFVKAVLAVHNSVIPPLAHAGDHDPHSEARASTTLAVPRTATPWAESQPRRAGVTSLGIGETNVHIIVEEHIAQPPRSEDGPALLVWSAKSEWSADEYAQRLGETVGETRLVDAAHTLERGRATFEHRRWISSTDATDAAAQLQEARVGRVPDAVMDGPRRVAFMYGGYGVLRFGVASSLVGLSDSFDAVIDAASAAVRQWTELDLRRCLVDPDFSTDDLALLGLATVTFQVAVTRMFADWGFAPDVVMGSSLGEYAAAHTAGALELEPMLRLVFERGRLLQTAIGGAMLLVELPFDEVVASYDGNEVEQGLDISTQHCVVSGPANSIDELAERLTTGDVYHAKLPIPLAFHSKAVEGIRQEFLDATSGITMAEPILPLASNLTGKLLTNADVQSPTYWYDQMRNSVQFRQNVSELYAQGARYFVEISPGVGLVRLCKWALDGEDALIRSCVSHPRSERPHIESLLDCVGAAWALGRPVDVEAVNGEGRLVSLPPYAFEHLPYYLGEPLPQRRQTKRTRETPVVPPSNPLVESVAVIFQEVLGLNTVSIDDDFFDLGGDSLQATRVLGRIQSEFGSDIKVSQVMENRTVRKLAQLIHEEGGAPVAENHFCAFELDIGGQLVQVFMTREEYDENGLPEGATNIEILG
jgi:acyl transferase domain-containing protein